MVVEVLALGAGGNCASEAQRTPSRAALTGVAADLSIVAVGAVEQALVVEVEVGHSADVGAGLAVDAGGVAGEAGGGAVPAGEEERVLVLTWGAVLGASVDVDDFVVAEVVGGDLALGAGLSAPAVAELAPSSALGAPVGGNVGVVVVGTANEATAIDFVVEVPRIAISYTAVGRQPVTTRTPRVALRTTVSFGPTDQLP